MPPVAARRAPPCRPHCPLSAGTVGIVDRDRQGSTLRIARIEAFEIHRLYDGRAFNPAWRWHERRAPLLRLTNPDGIAALGEGWSDPADPWAFYPEAYRQARSLLGAPADAPAGPPWAQAGVRSALEIARAGLQAQAAARPLHRHLGSNGPDAPVYASGGLYTDRCSPLTLAAEMAAYAARGFGAVKLKIAARPLQDDLARVGAVRRALGPGPAIIVDALARLTRATAPIWIDALAPLGVIAIQAPLHDADLDGMAALQARGPLPVIAGEREHDRARLAALLDAGAVGILQLCPGLTGIAETIRLVGRAHAAAIPTTLQCYSTAVLQAACFHLAAGRPGIHSAEYHQFHDSLYAALPFAMTRVRDGHLQLDDHPGLGIDPTLPDRPPGGPTTIRRIFTLPD